MQELSIEDFKRLKVGESLEYHNGNLAYDRMFDTKLSLLAYQIMQLSTTPIVSFDFKGASRGSGTRELELYQIPVKNGCRYMARRRRVKAWAI